MKRLIVFAAALLGACSSVAPSDPFAHLCRPQSFASCPTDTDSPVRLAGQVATNAR
jgi:uncharacterized lipoprotein YmbA